MGFSRHEYWSGLPFPPPEGLSDPGTESTSLMSPESAGRFFTTSATWGAQLTLRKPIIQKNTLTPMFTALFTTAKTRKQPRHPSTEGWIKKLWFIYTIESYSAIEGAKLGHL